MASTVSVDLAIDITNFAAQFYSMNSFPLPFLFIWAVLLFSITKYTSINLDSGIQTQTQSEKTRKENCFTYEFDVNDYRVNWASSKFPIFSASFFLLTLDQMKTMPFKADQNFYI